MFLGILYGQIISWSQKKKKKWFQDYSFSWDKSDKICEMIFSKILHWIGKISHKDCLTLSHVKQQSFS